MDAIERIYRRVSKEQSTDQIVLNKRTSCSHEVINYIVYFQGLSKQETDYLISQKLRALKDWSKLNKLRSWMPFIQKDLGWM